MTFAANYSFPTLVQSLSMSMCFFAYLVMGLCDFSVFHSVVFWMGDLNYRLVPTLQVPETKLKEMAHMGVFKELLQHDQVHACLWVCCWLRLQ